MGENRLILGGWSNIASRPYVNPLTADETREIIVRIASTDSSTQIPSTAALFAHGRKIEDDVIAVDWGCNISYLQTEKTDYDLVVTNVDEFTDYMRSLYRVIDAHSTKYNNIDIPIPDVDGVEIVPAQQAFKLLCDIVFYDEVLGLEGVETEHEVLHEAVKALLWKARDSGILLVVHQNI